MAEAELLYAIEEDGRPIKVWQQSGLRWLEFGDELIQTEIDLARPNYLPESFNRAMLSGALFTGQVPKKVLLAGTGVDRQHVILLIAFQMSSVMQLICRPQYSI